jgi:N-acyl homoserine lactone hydrolase
MPLARIPVHLTSLRHLLRVVLTLVALAPLAVVAQDDIRLYAFDCGHAQFSDFSIASDTGELDGRAAELADPCFLVKHPRGWLLWDAGLPPGEPIEQGGRRVQPAAPLSQQLNVLGIAPKDVGLIAFSHLHFDHVGNANQFAQATWLLNRSELAWAQAEPAHVSMQPQWFSAYAQAQVRWIDGDHDVFGDGRVRILLMPGHTPGSLALLLRLRKTGAVLLSGDLYISDEGRAKQLVPRVNANRADTLASMARFERIAKNLSARVVVQHDPAEFARLPRPPAFLD